MEAQQLASHLTCILWVRMQELHAGREIVYGQTANYYYTHKRKENDMGFRMQPHQVKMPDRLYDKIRRHCEKESARIGERFTVSRFLRESAEKELGQWTKTGKGVERHG